MKRMLLAAAGLLLAVSCNKGDELASRTGNADKEKTVFYATTEGAVLPSTKIYADEDLRVLWNENDCISIFNNANVNDKYMFDGEDGDNSGGFSFEQEGEEPAVPAELEHIYAVYPYSEGTQVYVDEGNVTVAFDLPAEQLYRERSFGLGANTMIAVTDGNFLGFKNVCGYLKFRFYGDDVKVKSITLEGNNGEKIAGKASITPSLTSAPTIALDAAATTSITINCEEPVTLGTSSTDCTEFVFVIPPTTFENGFKVTVIDEAGDVFEKSSSRSLAISRNKMESMGAMKVTPAPVPEPVLYNLVTRYEELTEGSEIIIVSTAYDKAMATEMWSSPLRKEADITKSSDKTVVENPGVDVQVFTLKKGSADNTVMFECKNGEFAGQYIGAKLTANPTDLSWKYLFNCTSATTERGISFNVDLQRNGDALIGPFDTQNNYKYMSYEFSNRMFCMEDAYISNYAVAIYKLEGTGEGDPLIVHEPEIQFTSGVNTPSGYAGMDYVGNTMYLPAAGGSYTVEFEVKYPVEGGFMQNVININGGGYNTIPGLVATMNASENKIEITLPENTDSSSRSAYMIVEYSYKDEEGKWHNITKWLYIAQTGHVIK